MTNPTPEQMDRLYTNVFAGNPDGAQVFNDLFMFCKQTLMTEDVYRTHVHIGMHMVMDYIMQRIDAGSGESSE